MIHYLCGIYILNAPAGSSRAQITPIRFGFAPRKLAFYPMWVSEIAPSPWNRVDLQMDGDIISRQNATKSLRQRDVGLSICVATVHFKKISPDLLRVRGALGIYSGNSIVRCVSRMRENTRSLYSTECESYASAADEGRGGRRIL